MALTPQQKQYLDSLSDQEVEKLVKGQQPTDVTQGILPKAGNILKNFAVGAGRTALGLDPTKGNSTDEMNEFIAKEQVKKAMEGPKKWEPTTREEALSYDKQKSENTLGMLKLQRSDEEAKKKNDLYAQNVRDSATDAIDTITEVEKGIGHFGLTGSLPSIPGTPRAKWEANLGKLLSSKVIDVMTKMKEASKTGATGFGQLSEKELKVLQEASTALNRNLSPKDAQEILTNMKTKLQKITASEQIDLTQVDPEYQKYLQSIGG